MGAPNELQYICNVIGKEAIMARRSRAVIETARPKYRVWRIAIYIRLSKEDMRCLDESESVTNQRQIIEDHIGGFNDGD